MRNHGNHHESHKDQQKQAKETSTKHTNPTYPGSSKAPHVLSALLSILLGLGPQPSAHLGRVWSPVETPQRRKFRYWKRMCRKFTNEITTEII